MSAALCRCGHTTASHLPMSCRGCTGPACVENPAVHLVTAAVLSSVPVNSLADDVAAALAYVAAAIHEDTTEGNHIRRALGLRWEARRPFWGPALQGGEWAMTERAAAHRSVGRWVDDADLEEVTH